MHFKLSLIHTGLLITAVIARPSQIRSTTDHELKKRHFWCNGADSETICPEGQTMVPIDAYACNAIASAGRMSQISAPAKGETSTTCQQQQQQQQTSLEDSSTPLEESSTPLEESSTPLEESSTPLEESSTPLEESSTPLEESSTPLEESSTPPVVHRSMEYKNRECTTSYINPETGNTIVEACPPFFPCNREDSRKSELC